MSSTKIRGNTQIMDFTVDLDRLKKPFLTTSTGTPVDWNITNGNNDALITGLKTCTQAKDAANKEYVDSVAAGIDWKESSQFTTLTNITGAVYTSTGGVSSTGAFTNVDLTSTGIFDFGAHSVAVDDRVLVKDQTDAKQNGIYVVTSTGTTGGLVRAPDHDGLPGSEVSGGNATFIENGDTYAKTGWVLQGDGELTLNTDDLVWVQFSGAGSYTAGDGLDLTGTTFSVDVTDIIGEGLTESSNNIDIAWGGTGGNYGTATTVARSDHTHSFATSLDSLTDVDVTGAVAGDILILSGDGTWYDRTLSGDITVSSTGVVEIQDDSIQESDIDWGSGADQIDATSIPLDSGGTYSGSATNVQDALEELEGAQAKWTTIVVPNGSNPVADAASDTLTLQSSSGAVIITGYDDPEIVDFDVQVDDLSIEVTSTGLQVKADGIKDTHIDWGTGAGQVSATDIPVATTNFDGILSGADTTVLAALETIDDHNHDGTYTDEAFKTIVPTTGENVVADTIEDTLTLQSSSGVVVITGNAAGDSLDFDVAADSIDETHIDWGSGANQVDASSVPIDSGGTYGGSATNIQDALEELEGLILGTKVFNEKPTVTHSNPNVTLNNTPVAGTVRVYLNGLRQVDPDDYSISGTTITFTDNLLTTPGQSDVVIVDYCY